MKKAILVLLVLLSIAYARNLNKYVVEHIEEEVVYPFTEITNNGVPGLFFDAETAYRLGVDLVDYQSLKELYPLEQEYSKKKRRRNIFIGLGVGFVTGSISSLILYNKIKR